MVKYACSLEFGGCSSAGLERFPVEEEVGSSNLLNHPNGTSLVFDFFSALINNEL